MTKYEFIITLIKERILKPKTIIILLLLFLFAVYFFPLVYHTLNKLFNPGLKESTIDTPFGNSSNKYRSETGKVIDREHPEFSFPPTSDSERIKQQESEILKLKKLHIVDLATITVATPTWQMKDSPITKDLAESLKDLRISDPNSEIIPLTKAFLSTYTAEDASRSKVINGVWQR